MKLKFCLYALATLLIIQAMYYITLESESSIKNVASAKKSTQVTPNNTSSVTISDLQDLQRGIFTTAPTERVAQAWKTLYQYCQSATKDSELTPPQALAIAPLFEINHFENLAKDLDSKNFPELPNDPQGQLHRNYAIEHMGNAVARLNSIFKITLDKDVPTTQFAGDNRDVGVIVNIKNNTDMQFSIMQSSLDGKTKVQIGQLDAGLNQVNLHTAALQSPALQKTNKIMPSTNCFDFYEMNAQSPSKISIRMMSGEQLVNFLQTLPRKNKNIFEMNGLPTSAQYLATPNDWYMVLIQNPTPATARTRNFDQRIQAINVSKLSGPYLITMHIHKEKITIESDNPSITPHERTALQSSFSLVKTIKSKALSQQIFPLLVLPQFLWNLPQLQLDWMVLTTSWLSALTNFKLFGPNSFANAFEYFKGLNCFNKQHNYSLFIDLYNRFIPDYVLYNAPWLIATALYETNLKASADIPQIYTSQDTFGHIVVNERNFYYINFLAIFTPKIADSYDQDFFNDQGFNATYNNPLNQLYSFVVNARAEDIKTGVFATLTETAPNAYQITWTNKKNDILHSQYLYLENPISNVEISFVNQTSNWIGSAVPATLIPTSPGEATNFKVTYEFSSTNSKHILLTQATSAIDKQEVFLPLQFSEFPIKELYLNLFNTFNVAPYTQCHIVKDGMLPTPLTTLTTQDWQSGIYMVPIIPNNKNIHPGNPGNLIVKFYKSDKSYLGEISIPGKFNNGLQSGIQEPVHAYNAHFSEYNCLMDLYLSTGVLLQYNQIN